MENAQLETTALKRLHSEIEKLNRKIVELNRKNEQLSDRFHGDKSMLVYTKK